MLIFFMATVTQKRQVMQFPFSLSVVRCVKTNLALTNLALPTIRQGAHRMACGGIYVSFVDHCFMSSNMFLFIVLGLTSLVRLFDILFVLY